ncbi:hypothetical protein [Streptomyces scabiei]|nr:hypothetical protein [Streptomyces scabiei]
MYAIAQWVGRRSCGLDGYQQLVLGSEGADDGRQGFGDTDT